MPAPISVGGHPNTSRYVTARKPGITALAYVDFRKVLLRGELPEFTCMIGTMAQEMYGKHPEGESELDRRASRTFHAGGAAGRGYSCQGQE